ncbi:hypothetical protein Hypma_014941 [Hypsizygus marmoreus]|uniref:F-box domain-containing protein n=1 Tax=Hypsizygus marmoreus TaxID=39966 RepID=A0A369K6R4_HYPMA|nr:hypothetical protein Hypma_014941 [Hypsizygus marmoreus]
MTGPLQSTPIHAEKHIQKAVASLSSVQSGAARKALLQWAQRDLHHSLTFINKAAPIGSIPPEILCQIFEIANGVKQTEDYRPWSYPSRHKSLPIVVSQVSRYWRDVAINYPLLWTDIDISPPWSLNTIRLFLSRSQTCPIALSLAIPSLYIGSLLSPTAINTSAWLLYDVIASHIPRCRRITVKGDFERTMPLLDAFLNTIQHSSVPLLEQLVFHVTGVSEFNEEHQDVGETPLFQLGAPSLTHVRLSGFAVPNCLPPLSQVTSLHLSVGDSTTTHLRSSFYDFSEMLLACPSLNTLAIYDDFVWGPWPPTSEISLPSLRSLQIYGTFTCVSDLLRVIVAPLLEDLVIAPVVMDDLLEYHQFHHSTTSPKFRTLRSLTLSPVSAAGFELVKLAAECFPAVEQLTIPNIDSEGFLAVFTDPTIDVLWPDLKTLALRDIDGSTKTALLKFLSFRNAAAYSLQSLCLDASSIQLLLTDIQSLDFEVDVVERDVWSILRRDDPLHKESQFVGNDFVFGR